MPVQYAGYGGIFMSGQVGSLVQQVVTYSPDAPILAGWPMHLATAFLLSCLPHSAIAQELTGIQIEPSHANVGQPVAISLSFETNNNQESFNCGLRLTLGDGTVKEVRVSEKDMPLRVNHAYQATGVFSVTAEGKTMWRGIQTAFACGGVARSAPVSVHAEGAAEKAVADEKATAEALAAAKRAAAARTEAERRASEESRAAAQANANANRAAASRAAAERRATEEKVSAERRASEERAASARSAKPIEIVPKTTDRPAKQAPVKARSAMDL